MSDTDTRPLWRIWRDAEDAALDGIEATDLEQVDAICDAARIEALMRWLLPDRPPEEGLYWLIVEGRHQIRERLTREIERCRERA